MSVVSKARLTACLAIATATGDKFGDALGDLQRLGHQLVGGEDARLTRLARSASAASIIRPVRIMSIAFDLPMARVSRCVPPAPGMTPRLISGWPKLRGVGGNDDVAHHRQFAAAAKREAGDRGDHRLPDAQDRLPALADEVVRTPGKVRSFISLMSAPAANAFSEPVSTIAPIAGSASKARKLRAEFVHQLVAQRVQRLRGG